MACMASSVGKPCNDLLEYYLISIESCFSGVDIDVEYIDSLLARFKLSVGTEGSAHCAQADPWSWRW